MKSLTDWITTHKSKQLITNNDNDDNGYVYGTLRPGKNTTLLTW